jgi:class 3 adenylate cyclase
VLWGVPAFLLMSVEMAGHPSAAYPGAAVLAPIWLLAVTLEGPALICAVTYVPDRPGRELGWVRLLGCLTIVRGPLAASAAYGALMSPVHLGLPLMSGVTTLHMGGIVGVLTFSYLRSDALGRRQLRWTLLGVWLAALPALFILPVTVLDAKHIPLLFGALAAFAIVPVFLVISILRYNWFDVDRLLSATASYNLLGMLLLGVGLVVAPRVGNAASGLLGVEAETGQTLTAFLLAVALVPAQRGLRPRLERLFFPERRAVEEGATQLRGALAVAGQPRALTETLGSGLQALYRTESLAIYAPQQDGFGVVFARGRAVPPAMDAAAPLIPTLAKRARPLAIDDKEGEALTPIDRALLETLAARSGDVYTSTDLGLLAGIADKAGAELRGFDQERRLREAKEMQESLRRYVPGAVAEQLTSGRDLRSRECEVSVLFVDIRGYTAWSEERGAADVFSRLNRYTEAVSEVVTRFGGSVVEFNGDGMMAVFGAPEEIPEKERAAVFAARELCAAVPALDAEGELSVGVGVATGPAFVGAIRAVDRLIWSAIGNTTNLAARLQSLTRELDAAVVIDAATWGGAASVASDFVRLDDLEVRGRSARMTVFRLPLAASPSA